MKFTLVVPTYNEAEIIDGTLQALISAFTAKVSIPWSIIVADNASSDGTANIVEALHDSRVSTVCLKEKGKGRAVRAGFSAAGGGIVALTDSDLPISPADIIRGLEMILRDECEIVIGSRFTKGSDVSERPKLRNGLSMVFLILAKTIVGLRASDSQCPLKIMNERTTPIMLATEDPTWWPELEFVLLVERLGIRMKELPVVWHEKQYAGRLSTVVIFRDGFRAIIAMFKIRLQLAKKIKKLQNTLN